ncbi:MAG TPA: AraC family transcriptional regulator, partial [Cytophagales bacterium]|nr:AraC family transcriptional regulator [Cytophagales bacterium]
MSYLPQHRVFFLVPPQVHLLDVSGPIHLFYEARAYGANLELRFLRMHNQEELRSSAGLFLAQLESYQKYSLGATDILFVPGIESLLLHDDLFREESAPFYRWLQDQQGGGAKICSVCTGAYLLAQAGILNGRSCTTHWKYLEDFKERFPQVTLLQDRLFVKDGTTYSSAGVASGIDLSLYILEELYGTSFAIQIAREVVVYLRRGDDDPQLSVFLQYRNHLENRVHQAQDFLSQHLEKPISIERLGEVVNMSSRNLPRLFKKTTGITIGQYTDQLRVERAVQLLSEGYKVETVSQMCGLKSPNQLRTILKKY